MTPRNHIEGIDLAATRGPGAALVTSYHTQVPVYDGGMDTIAARFT
jgi:Mg2+/Co2+ transporter CorB